MENFLEILQGLPNNKWIKQKFEFQDGIAAMTRQEIAIYS